MASIPVTPKPSSIAGAVNSIQGKSLPAPAGLAAFDTSSLGDKYFHCVIFGPTNSGKTSLAAAFAGPEDTRIIVTRNKSQLIPLEGQGYKGVTVDNMNAFLHATMYPEKLFGAEWAARPNRTLVIDDLTEVSEMSKEDNQTNDDGREIRDKRQVFGAVKIDLRSVFRSTVYKLQNVIFTSLVRIGKDPVRKMETVVPEVPPSVFHMLGAEIEYAFYIDETKKKLLTEPEMLTVIDPTDIDPLTKSGRVYRREIFAKYKQPNNVPKILAKYEDMDLKKIWDKVHQVKGK